MIEIYGEYEVTLDSKGRFMLPTGLKKQLGEAEGVNFMINRGFEKCVTIYTNSVWSNVIAKISKLNDFNPKARKFKRLFLNGATRLEADAAGRLLIPKGLLAYAGIEGEVKDLMLVGQMDRIELWPAAEYKKKLEEDFDEFDELGGEVMGSDFTNPTTE